MTVLGDFRTLDDSVLRYQLALAGFLHRILGAALWKLWAHNGLANREHWGRGGTRTRASSLLAHDLTTIS